MPILSNWMDCNENFIRIEHFCTFHGKPNCHFELTFFHSTRVNPDFLCWAWYRLCVLYSACVLCPFITLMVCLSCNFLFVSLFISRVEEWLYVKDYGAVFDGCLWCGMVCVCVLVRSIAASLTVINQTCHEFHQYKHFLSHPHFIHFIIPVSLSVFHGTQKEEFE